MSTSKDRPWLVRTYSGHSSARTSNELYRSNLAKGQTGLSVAFDLPTQTGYDPDHPLARGEVGKVGVPISHLDDMDVLFDQLPLDQIFPIGSTQGSTSPARPARRSLHPQARSKHRDDPSGQNKNLRPPINRRWYLPKSRLNQK